MEARYQLRQCPAVLSDPGSIRLRAPDEQYRLTRVEVKSSRPDRGRSGGLRRTGRPLLPPLVRQRDEDGADDRADDAARPQVESVAGQQADQQTSDEGADQSRRQGHGPVDLPPRAAEDELGDGTGHQAEDDESEDEHASILEPASRAAGLTRPGRPRRSGGVPRTRRPPPAGRA